MCVYIHTQIPSYLGEVEIGLDDDGKKKGGESDRADKETWKI